MSSETKGGGNPPRAAPRAKPRGSLLAVQLHGLRPGVGKVTVEECFVKRGWSVANVRSTDTDTTVVFTNQEDAATACNVGKFIIGGDVVTATPTVSAGRQLPALPPSERKSPAVFLSGLPNETHEDDIRKYFCLYGWPVAEVQLEADGYGVKKALVVFESSEHVDLACQGEGHVINNALIKAEKTEKSSGKFHQAAERHGQDTNWPGNAGLITSTKTPFAAEPAGGGTFETPPKHSGGRGRGRGRGRARTSLVGMGVNSFSQEVPQNIGYQREQEKSWTREEEEGEKSCPQQSPRREGEFHHSPPEEAHFSIKENVKDDNQVAAGRWRQVFVSNIPEAMADAETLEGYFQVKRRSGGDQSAVVQLLGNGLAIVEYSTEEVAARVASQTHKIPGHQSLTVIPYTLDGSIVSQILVSGLPEGVGAEDVQDYFENKRSGGGQVLNVEISDVLHQAIVTFQDPAVVTRVCATRSHSIFREPVSVESFDSTASLLVQGIPTECESYMLELYFESKRSGGDETAKVRHESTSPTAIVSYSTPRVAMQVHQQRTHAVGKVKSEVQVELYSLHRAEEFTKETVTSRESIVDKDLQLEEVEELSQSSKFEMDKLLLLEIPEGVTEENIQYFVSAASGGLIVLDVALNRDFGRALVTFNADIDFPKVESYIQRKPLSGFYMQVRRVAVSRVVRVCNAVDANATDEMIRWFFEAKQLAIEKVENGENGELDITFQTEEGANAVLQKMYVYNGKCLTLRLAREGFDFPAHDDVNPDGSYIFTTRAPPAEFQEELDSLIAAFLQTSAMQQERVNADLGNVCAKAAFTTTHIVLSPTTDAVKMLNWKSKVKRALKPAVHERFKKTSIPVPPEAVEGCLKDDDFFRHRLGGWGDCFTLFTDLSQNHVLLSGDKEAVKETIPQVKKLIEEEVEAVRSQRTDTVQVKKAHQMQLIMKDGILEELKRHYPNVSFSCQQPGDGQGKGSIQIHGRGAIVREVKADLREKLSEITEVSIDFDGDAILCRLMTSPRGQQTVQDFLAKKDGSVAVCIIRKQKGSQIGLAGWSEEELFVMKEEVMQLTATEFLTLSEAEVAAMNTASWSSEVIDHISDNHRWLVEVESNEGDRTVTLHGLRDSIEEAKEHICGWLQRNAIRQKIIPLRNKGFPILLKEHFRDQLERLEMKMEDHAVKINIKGRYLCIRGSANGLQQATAECEKILHGVKEDEVHISLAGMGRFFEKQETTRQLDRLVRDYKTVIVEHCPTPEDFHPESFADAGQGGSSRGIGSPHPVASALTFSEQKVIIARGDITKQHCDAIVNAANEQLQHGSGVARAIAVAGGNVVEADSKDFIRRNHQLPTTQVYPGKAGKLPCKVLIHAVGPRWNQGRLNERRALATTCKNILNAADKRGLRSIAMPAISSGIFGFPMNVCVNTLLEAVADWFEKHSYQTQLREVIFVDVNDKAIQEFTDCLGDYFTVESEAPSSNGAGQWGNDGFASGYENYGMPPPVPARRPMASGQASHHGWGCHLLRGPQSGLKTAEGRTIAIREGDICRQSVDMIVNSANSDLNLQQGAVAKNLSTSAGKSLQSECLAYVKQHGPVCAGGFVVTKGYKLKCKKVCHVVCPQYDHGDKAVQVFKDMLVKCFTEANRNGITSIAVPSLGTGILGFPAAIVAKTMLSAALEFSRKQSAGSLKDIHFTIFDKNILHTFLSEADNVCCTAPDSNDEEEGEGIWHDDNYDDDDSGSKSEVSDGSMDDVAIPAIPWTDDGQRLYMVIPGSQVQLEVYQGDLSQEPVESIVTSASQSLKMSENAMSKALLKAAGSSVQVECDNVKKTSKSINFCDAFTTGAGQLKECKKIVHAVCPRYDQSKGKANLEKLITNCLTDVKKNGLNSVAIPALGAGGLGYPPQECAQATYSAISKFTTNPGSVTKINIVIFNAAHLSPFQQEFKQHFSPAKGAGAPGIFAQVKSYLPSLPSFLSSNSHSPDTTTSGGKPPSSLKTTRSVDMLAFKPKHTQADGSWKATLVGRSSRDVSAAKTAIHAYFKENHTVEKVESKSVSKAAAKDSIKIDALQDKLGVSIRRSKNGLELAGDARSVTVAKLEILDILQNAADEAHQEERAHELYSRVKWVRILGDHKEEYGFCINLQLEDAYQNKQRVVKFSTGGRKFTVDVIKMEESMHPGYTVKVERRDLTAPKVNWPPAGWDAMAKDDLLRLVQLPSGSAEYKSVHAKFSLTCKRNVTEIQRIQNPKLFLSYQAYVDGISHDKNCKKGPNELDLWHGSDADAIKKIYSNGFQRNFAGRNATVYGHGDYFARDASYSERYSTAHQTQPPFKMLLVKVAVGDYCAGTSDTKQPPSRDGTSGTTNLYCTTVDNTSNPTIYVSYHDAQKYPTHLITFT